MSTKLSLDNSELLCLLVLRSMECLRERTVTSPVGFRRVLSTLEEVQAYESKLQECFVETRRELSRHMEVLHRLSEADECWTEVLPRFSEGHPPLQIALRSSGHLTKQHIAFAEELEACGHVMGLLHKFTSRSLELRYLWVLPDLIDLYQLLHSLLDTTIYEEKAKDMPIGALLDLLQRRGAGDPDLPANLLKRFGKAEAQKNCSTVAACQDRLQPVCQRDEGPDRLRGMCTPGRDHRGRSKDEQDRRD